jgi:hypothetical protein
MIAQGIVNSLRCIPSQLSTIMYVGMTVSMRRVSLYMMMKRWEICILYWIKRRYTRSIIFYYI